MTTAISQRPAGSPDRQGGATGTPESPCLHCGQDAGGERFCCPGCAAVHDALHERGLTRYYRLRDTAGVPPGPLLLHTGWLEPIEETLHAAHGVQRRQFDLQGLHCTACVWLIERLFERTPGAEHILINPGAGQVTVTVRPEFPLIQFARELAAFGYTLGPAHRRDDVESDELLLRLGICAALALNSMVLSAALYLGLSDGALWSLFRQLIFAMGTVSVAVGGSTFVVGAWRAARRGIAHLDQPIAFGIVLAFAGSCWAYWQGSDAFYFDTLSVFIALMLGGRWLQERVLRENRRRLLRDDGIDALIARRERDGRVEWTTCGRLRAGDRLLIGPRDLVPASARLVDGAGTFSLDWIDGESQPLTFEAGDELSAGAFNAGTHPVRVELCENFDASELRSLLGNPADVGRSQEGSFWRHAATIYVSAVLGTAAIAGAVWWLVAGPEQALTVATALLVVTCPCAFGIATP